ncbi:MAG: divergent PAP2 family protein [Treponema sp.]|jgi:acid phosphatase family membrane protein YuiD|nr:divergent PAP2 family protein [Treponema sp.]
MSIALSLKTEQLKSFFENSIFLSSVSSWLFAQLLKSVIFTLRGDKKSKREILETVTWRTGGMPSSHAALVSSMTTAMAFKEGVGSNLFIVTLFLALIVMRDAMGVRRASGLQARTLNALGRVWSERMGGEYHPVKEIQGHSPLEVVVGGLLGIFISAAYAFL